jgi:hypothetical protein
MLDEGIAVSMARADCRSCADAVAPCALTFPATKLARADQAIE